MWGLVPWQRVEPRPPALGVWSLSHWTGREVPCIWFFFLMCGSKNNIYLLRLLSFKHIPTDNQGRKRQEGAQDENITRSTWKANRGPEYSTGSPASCHQNGNAILQNRLLQALEILLLTLNSGSGDGGAGPTQVCQKPVLCTWMTDFLWASFSSLSVKG